MSNDEDVRIREAVEAVSDGRSVDWDRERTLQPEAAGVLDQLRVLQRVSAVVRTRASDSADPAPAIRRWGRLQLLEPIGFGSFGEVYRAFDTTLRVEVALKLLREEAIAGEGAARFMEEARQLARVRHANVVQVHGVETHDGRTGMWCELVHGMTLERLLSVLGRQGAHEAALIGMQLCRALAAVHAAGLVHLDLKAANVMREEGGRIVLMDFGTVCDLSWTASSRMGGTPLAMAPEQVRGDSVGPATDLYGLGVLLYRLVTLTYPVDADSLRDLVLHHERALPIRDELRIGNHR